MIVGFREVALLLLAAQCTGLKLEGSVPGAIWTEPKPAEPQCKGRNYDTTEWSEMSLRKKAGPAAFEDLEGGQRNMCYNGHFVPELLVLGSIQGSTTSLCAELRGSSNLLWPRELTADIGDTTIDSEWKEGHYFDCHFAEGVQGMANSYQNCTKRRRMIAVDGSASYFSDFRVPPIIQSWYQMMSMEHMLKFVVMLREPLERLHSHFYHSQKGSWCSQHANMDFAQAVDAIIYPMGKKSIDGDGEGAEELTEDLSGCWAFLEASLYPKYLRIWFQHFPPRQFYIVPFKYNVDPGNGGRPTQTVSNFILNELGVKQGSPETQIQSLGRMKANVVHHTSLIEDLDRGRLRVAREYFRTYSNPLQIANILKNTRAHLYGYQGQMQDDASIGLWVRDNW